MSLEDHILFIDGEAIVLDKPAGLPVDAPRAGGPSIEARIGELTMGFQRMPVPMHRLDRDTSGCLLFARNPRARKIFQQAFESKTVQKTYLAILDGVPDGTDGVIDLPLAKRSTAESGWRMVGDPKGQAARTGWRLLAQQDGQSLVAFRPETGRTHQIRVHAAEGLGCAVVGDPVYGRRGGPMLLHASRLQVPRSPRPPIDVVAPLPDHWPDWAREA